MGQMQSISRLPSLSSIFLPVNIKFSFLLRLMEISVLIISIALLPKQDPRETWQETRTLDPASQSQPQVKQVGWWPQEPQLMTQVSDPLNLQASETVTQNCHRWPSVREGPAGERTIHLCLRRKNGFQPQASRAKPAYQAFSIGTHPSSEGSRCMKTLGKAPVLASVQ